MITQIGLHELLDYNPVTGWFTNRVRRGHAGVGIRAGTVHIYGYRQIQIGGYIYKEHRLAWLYVFGYMPDEIDHKDGKRDHNAIANLREATRSQNNANSERATGKSGLRGVTWSQSHSMWKAQIKISGQCVHLGYFTDREEAHATYLVAVDKVHGEYARHNRQPSERRV